MMNLSVGRLSEKEFLDAKHEWNSLLEKSVTNEVFLLWEWIYSWWEVFKDSSRELYLLRGKNPMGETIGIAPFYLQKQTLFGTHKRNIIRFCSSLETYPDHLDILATKEYEHLFSEAILEYLIQNDKDWDLIKLDGVDENSIFKKYLTSTPTEGKGLIMTTACDSKCPYLVIDRSFEDYLRSFSPKKRQTLLRKRRILLEREKAILKTVRCDEDPEKYIRELFALHGERARQKGIRTTFSGENIYTFHKKVIHSLLKDSKVVLAFLYKGVSPLVSYYCIKHNKKVYYYQAGLSYEGEKRSAGTVLFSLLLEDAFEERDKEFDFLRGSEEYKYFWTKNYRENYSITLRKNDLSNRMAHYIHTLYRGARSRFQRIYKPGRADLKAGSKGVEFIPDARSSMGEAHPS
jgi:CelD/BcsL family acetyltransferase involved in cellulose biosynthesis